MKEFGAFLPMNREGVEYALANRDEVEQKVRDFVRVCVPNAAHIKVVFHPWDRNDPSGEEWARRQFGLPVGTCGTIGWTALTNDLGVRTS